MWLLELLFKQQKKKNVTKTKKFDGTGKPSSLLHQYMDISSDK